VFAVEDRASRFIAIALARATRQLAPGLATGMAVGAAVAAAAPAPGGTIGSGTKMGVRIDGAPASACEGHARRWRPWPWRFGSGVVPLLAGFPERLVDATGKGLRFFGTSASARLGVKGRFGLTRWTVGERDRHQQAEQDESNQ
jgi:hypothetical protein